MSEAIGQPGGTALPRPMGIGEILSTAFRVLPAPLAHLVSHHRRGGRPITLLQYLVATRSAPRARAASGVVIEPPSWAVGLAGLVTALAGLVMFWS